MSEYTLGTVSIPAKASTYIHQVISNQRLSYGYFAQTFEQRFADLHESKYAIFCNSGTGALHTILSALKIRYNWSDGDEVLVPAITFVATINAVIHAGLTPVLVDVDPKSYNINPSLIEKHISSRTKAIMPVHLFGKPAEMESIQKIANANKLLVIEDSCEAVGTTYKGKKVGSWGVAAAFSTHSAHILTTGIGGVITTSDSQLADIMRSLINHGRDTTYISIDDDDNVSGKKLQKMIDSRFCFREIGYSYRITELEAAIGLAQLENFQKVAQKRIKHVAYLKKALLPLTDYIQLPETTEDIPIYMAYPLVVRQQISKQVPTMLQELMLYLETKGIETRPFFPILGQPAYKSLDFQKTSYPVATLLGKSGLYVGCHQDLERSDLDYLVSILTSFFVKH